MLAKFLRRALTAQVLGAAALGYWLSFNALGVVTCALLIPLGGHALSIAITAGLSRAAAEPLALWWRSVWGEIRACIQVFVLRQPWTVAAPVCLPPTAGIPQVPVVLVHGYVCNHRIWDDTIALLRAQGHTVRAVNLEPLFTSIDDYAAVIERAVCDICQHTGANQVALVGHSMGGLAIRAWIRAHGTARVARVVTLGTPHAGTQLARATHTPNGREMAWDSPWLNTLAASEDKTTRALMHIALTAQDNIVYPQRAQVLEGAQVTVFEGIGHLQLCLEKPVLQWLVAQLATQPAR